MTDSMPHTQVLNRSKVFYTVAFDLLMVQQSPKEARLFPTQTLMALAEMEVPTNRLAWRRLRVRGEFQSTTDQRRIKSQCPLPIAHYPLPETSLCGSRVTVASNCQILPPPGRYILPCQLYPVTYSMDELDSHIIFPQTPRRRSRIRTASISSQPTFRSDGSLKAAHGSVSPIMRPLSSIPAYGLTADTYPRPN